MVIMDGEWDLSRSDGLANMLLFISDARILPHSESLLPQIEGESLSLCVCDICETERDPTSHILARASLSRFTDCRLCVIDRRAMGNSLTVATTGGMGATGRGSGVDDVEGGGCVEPTEIGVIAIEIWLSLPRPSILADDPLSLPVLNLQSLAESANLGRLFTYILGGNNL